MRLLLLLSTLFLSIVTSLVVKEPCCHVFEHRGAMFGPELPIDSATIFDYIPERPHVSSVEGSLKLTTKENAALCRPENVAKQIYHFEDSIALIPRGGCSFAEKVYFAQLLGAKAAIIFQAKPEGSSGTGNDDVIVMAEDSRYGNLVDIPSAFISYNSWMHILALLRERMLETDEDTQLIAGMMEIATSSPVARILRTSDEKVSDITNSLETSDADQSIQLKNEMADLTEIGLTHDQVLTIGRELSTNLVTVVLNATGSLPSTGPDALPMMWDSMIFLVKVFLIIWSVMGFAFISNWLKLRYKRFQRQHVIRSLPCKHYKKLQFHSVSKSKKGEKKKGKKVYSSVAQNEDIDLESNAPEVIESSVVTLEEYNPLLQQCVSRQNSDLKLRSPKKKRTDDLSNASSSSEESNNISVDSEAIECDNCVICLCEFEEEDMVTVLRCKHIYHKECIEPWLINKSSLCPICKQSIFKNGESRSINEINQSELEDDERHPLQDPEQRRGNVAVSIGMFLVIVLSFMFIVTDDNN